MRFLSLKLVFIIVICFSFSLTHAFSIQPAQYWLTLNAMPVYFIHLPDTSIVRLRLLFDAGVERGKNHSALAHYTANSVNIDYDFLANNGIQFNKVIDLDKTYFEIKTLNNIKSLQIAINVLQKIASDQHIEKNNHINSANLCPDADFPPWVWVLNNNDYLTQLDSEVRYILFKGQPYITQNCDEATKDFKTLHPKEGFAFRNKYYVAKNATLEIIGNLTKQKAQLIAEQISKHLLRGTKAEAPAFYPLSKGITKVMNTSEQDTYIYYGQIIPWHTQKDTITIMLGAELLQQILKSIIRSKYGLAYAIIGNGNSNYSA